VHEKQLRDKCYNRGIKPVHPEEEGLRNAVLLPFKSCEAPLNEERNF
jgi:hypothetical protein